MVRIHPPNPESPARVQGPSSARSPCTCSELPLCMSQGSPETQSEPRAGFVWSKAFTLRGKSPSSLVIKGGEQGFVHHFCHRSVDTHCFPFSSSSFPYEIFLLSVRPLLSRSISSSQSRHVCNIYLHRLSEDDEKQKCDSRASFGSFTLQVFPATKKAERNSLIYNKRFL